MQDLDDENETPYFLIPVELMGNIYAQLFCAYTQDPERDKGFSDSKKFEDMLAISQDVALNADMPDVALGLARREFTPHETFHLLRQALVDNIGEEALKKMESHLLKQIAAMKEHVAREEKNAGKQ